MSTFEFLSVGISFVLGLAVAMVLRSFLLAFRRRRQTEMDWMPFFWASLVLLYAFQYWWTLFALSEVAQWTLGGFGLLLLMAGLLFVAGGLILPIELDAYPSALESYFEEDGRWGVGALVAYNIMGITANVALMGGPLDSVANVALGTITVLGVIVVMMRNRRVRVVCTLLAGLVFGVGVALATSFVR